MTEEYTEKQWLEEMNSGFFCGKHWPAGSCNISCPNCGTVGFYGPREDNSGRKYRACKYCGFWQEVWVGSDTKMAGKSYRCRATYCEKCQAYNWHMPGGGLGNCPKCGEEEKETKWAIDNPDHPFRKLKEQMDKTHQAL